MSLLICVFEFITNTLASIGVRISFVYNLPPNDTSFLTNNEAFILEFPVRVVVPLTNSFYPIDALVLVIIDELKLEIPPTFKVPFIDAFLPTFKSLYTDTSYAAVTSPSDLISP